jgi:hypothetical protein
LSKRNIRAATGVRATIAPAARPAAGPETRRTAAWSTATLATPQTACGTRMLQLERPNNRTEAAISQIAAGGLSTVIELPGSSAPKNIAFRLIEPAWAAAE